MERMQWVQPPSTSSDVAQRQPPAQEAHHWSDGQRGLWNNASRGVRSMDQCSRLVHGPRVVCLSGFFGYKDKSAMQTSSAKKEKGMWLQMIPSDAQCGGRAAGTQGLGLDVLHHQDSRPLLPSLSSASLSILSPSLLTTERSFPHARKRGRWQPQFSHVNRERRRQGSRRGL